MHPTKVVVHREPIQSPFSRRTWAQNARRALTPATNLPAKPLSTGSMRTCEPTASALPCSRRPHRPLPKRSGPYPRENGLPGATSSTAPTPYCPSSASASTPGAKPATRSPEKARPSPWPSSRPSTKTAAYGAPAATSVGSREKSRQAACSTSDPRSTACALQNRTQNPNEPAYLAAKRALHNAVPSTVPRGIGPGMPRPTSPWSRPGPSDVHPQSRRFPPWSEPLSGH